ncbi:MAG: hypothetical protein ABIN01_15715 [Ferruginibacter sp.]
MFNNVAFNVVIGLLFIYLLYSLLATVVSELIATKLALRARNLKEAIDRMLNDEKEKGWWARLWDSLKLTKNPDNKIINNFYNHPEIKYLGSSGIFKIPSSFKAVSFSKTLIYVLIGDEEITKEKVEARLNEIIRFSQSKNVEDDEHKILDAETAKYIHLLWLESYGDIVKFKLHLEAWFDRTMEQATEWYKRKIQIVLLVLGFCMAWVFNADTFSIISKLSTDPDARDKMVSMANAYVQSNNTSVDTSISKDSANLKSATSKLDSLLEVKKRLDEDIKNANTILGFGSWPPDTIAVSFDAKAQKKIYTPHIDAGALSAADKNINEGVIRLSSGDKWRYFFRLLSIHFFGFLVTAFAISLGAPFWFDLLNKLMRLRTSVKQETNSTTAVRSITVSPLNREA